MIKYCSNCDAKVVPKKNLCPSCNGVLAEEKIHKEERSLQQLVMEEKIEEIKIAKKDGKVNSILGVILILIPIFIIIKFEVINKWVLIPLGIGVFLLIRGLPYAFTSIKKFKRGLRDKYEK